jgi:hypothetical protein
MKLNAPPIPKGMLREPTFAVIRKFLMFAITNIEVLKTIEPQIKDLLKDTRDFEYSFDLKIAICSIIVIHKDRSPRQVDALQRFQVLMMAIQDYII